MHRSRYAATQFFTQAFMRLLRTTLANIVLATKKAAKSIGRLIQFL